jgi:hypothetical protein
MRFFQLLKLLVRILNSQGRDIKLPSCPAATRMQTYNKKRFFFKLKLNLGDAGSCSTPCIIRVYLPASRFDIDCNLCPHNKASNISSLAIPDGSKSYYSTMIKLV